jgi:hypothetical protein
LFVAAGPFPVTACPATSELVCGFARRDGSVLSEGSFAVVEGILAVKFFDLFPASPVFACRVAGDCAGNSFEVTTCRF